MDQLVNPDQRERKAVYVSPELGGVLVMPNGFNDEANRIVLGVGTRFELMNGTRVRFFDPESKRLVEADLCDPELDLEAVPSERRRDLLNMGESINKGERADEILTAAQAIVDNRTPELCIRLDDTLWSFTNLVKRAIRRSLLEDPQAAEEDWTPKQKALLGSVPALFGHLTRDDDE